MDPGLCAGVVIKPDVDRSNICSEETKPPARISVRSGECHVRSVVSCKGNHLRRFLRTAGVGKRMIVRVGRSK